MNNNIVCFLLGIIACYIIMYLSSNIVIYHGGNSNEIRKQIFEYNNKKYKFVPIAKV